MFARRGLRIAGLAVLAAAVAFAPGQATATSGDRANHFALSAGKKVFWEGAHIEFAQVPEIENRCHAAEEAGVVLRLAPGGDVSALTGSCFEYRIEVLEPAARLRVALQAILPELGYVRRHAADNLPPPWEMTFDVEILRRGEVVAEDSTACFLGLPSCYAVEVFLPNPSLETYSVRVIPESVIDMKFRMRARLEGEVTMPLPQDVPLSPNLRILPPFEFNFFSPTVTFGPGSGVPAPAASCMAEEVAMVDEAVQIRLEQQDPPQICLRYSMGIENTGKGRLAVDFFERIDDGKCPDFDLRILTCEGEQRRWTADGREVDESIAAGPGTWHPTHLHWHYQNIYEAQLFRLPDGWKPGDPRPAWTQVGEGRKYGVNPGMETFADWSRFWPACGEVPADATKALACHHDRDYLPFIADIWLQAGWADMYEWNRSGNYATFPELVPGTRIPLPGYYLIRMQTDPNEKIIESNEADNFSYALINVADIFGNVDLIERGYGADYWDLNKRPLSVSP